MGSRKPLSAEPSSLSLFPEVPSVPTPKGKRAKSGLPKGLKSDDYEIDEGDGLAREIVGGWVREKHARLQRYVEISGKAVRKKWLRRPRSAGATYIDLFSGPGGVTIRNSGEVLDGSPLVAWRQAVQDDAQFTQVFVADAHPAICAAVTTRLRNAGAPVHCETGDAVVTVDRVIAKLNPYALNFAFLDPYGLAALPFEVIKKLAKLERMDILIHVSAQDLNRNLRRYIEKSPSPLDTFEPEWRDHIDINRPDQYVRAKLLEYWRGLLKTVGMETAEVMERVSGPTNQPLYWLAFVARHKLALEFWEKIRDIEPDPQFELGGGQF